MGCSCYGFCAICVIRGLNEWDRTKAVMIILNSKRAGRRRVERRGAALPKFPT